MHPSDSATTHIDDSIFSTRDGQRFAVINGVHEFVPFLINVVSASDLWMFVSSRGGLTAGRGSAQGALFPYQTVDNLHEAHHTTGPICLLRVIQDESHTLWNPFGEPRHQSAAYNLYKNSAGNQIVFESIHHDLQLTATQRWTSAACLGHLRTVTITNHSRREIAFDFLDGVRNLLPWGVELGLQQTSSCLVDAYKRCEIDAETKLGVFCLSSKITDRAEPAEALRANVVWHTGLDGAVVTLSSQSLDLFRGGGTPPAESLLKGQRGNYFVSQQGCALGPGEAMTWHIVLDTGLDHVSLVRLRQALLEAKLSVSAVDAAAETARCDLLRLLGVADGHQASANLRATVHHLANTTFNCMRGGLFVDQHRIPIADFRKFVRRQNNQTFEANQKLLEVLDDRLPVSELRAACQAQGDSHLVRHCYEFLPMTFSRRHGDPSRPWNEFAIRVHDRDGKKIIHYEGNWRDIFQNWESTCTSFPEFFPGVVARFVNGSTADGFNPYRVTSEYLEWETPDPHDPWSHIGYWGDHQIVYLLRLIEALDRHDPAQLQEMLTEDNFTYLQLPYRLKTYGDIIRNRRDTIDFDWALDQELKQRVAAVGEDGKLLRDKSGQVYVVNLLEKLLVPALSKVSSFVVGGGIWMNTQRPEWNDANNALVGNGISVVTLAHLHRYSTFLLSLCQRMSAKQIHISREVCIWMQQIVAVLEQNRDALDNGVNDEQRRRILDELGEAFSDYRTIIYDHGFSKRLKLERAEIERFFTYVQQFTKQTLLENQRPDGLFHSYNLLDFGDNGSLRVKHLYEMLEGQVAAITSGALAPQRVIELVEQLFESRMYREDQHTFMLYPTSELADFFDRNVIPEKRVDENPLLAALREAGNDDLISRDALGVYRFHGDISLAGDVQRKLDLLAENNGWSQSVADHGDDVLDIFSNVFQHHAYTGRSGNMYRYEGIGCVYWHMVSKLLLAVQETFGRAIQEQQDAATIERLSELYRRVRRGLCFEKSPDEYGAFPTDPYSHTPGHTGAEQPGMTGQVKEGILARWGELGVSVKGGLVRFEPRLLAADEFIDEPMMFTYVDLEEELTQLELQAEEVAFTYCQVPVIYRLADQAAITLQWSSGRIEDIPGCVLSAAASADMLGRLGQLKLVRVDVDQALLLS